MNHTRSQVALFTAVIACASTFTAGMSQAQPMSGYVSDSRGAPIKSQFNTCWRTNIWTPSMATAECDPDLAPKAAARPVPAALAPAQRVPAPATAARPATVPQVRPASLPAPARVAAVVVAPRSCAVMVTLTADESFAFGKGVLSNAAKARLDKAVIAHLATCAKIDSINIEGHTDRLGNAAGNEKLALRRGEAVRAYLVSKNVPAKLVAVSSKGSSVPVQSCSDSGSRAKLISCLAPNRRVVIGIKGIAK